MNMKPPLVFLTFLLISIFCKAQLDSISIAKIDSMSVYSHHFEPVFENTFQRNLFGDTTSEKILITNSVQNFTANVFYKENNEQIKVSGSIEFSFEPNLYFDVSYEIDFQELFKKDEYAIITKTSYSFNRYSSTTINIWHVTKDSITHIYEFPLEEYSYSGLLTYEYSTNCSYEFVQDNEKFPKTLIIQKEVHNMYNGVLNDMEELVSATTEDEESTITVNFSYKNGKIIPTENIDVTFQLIRDE
ncbi:MAG: hypothetical protein JXL97_14515 [Bacteroidales bacterium]|nr:hypothetical protein [Bacteroidales bacterium]